MIVKLYSFYDLPFDHDVCHLFEHIVIRGFLFKLREHGYSRAFFGWQHGQTTDSTVFFELGAYNTEIVHLFENHLATLGEFEDTVVDQSIEHVEAEMRAEFAVTDRKLLKRQLKELSQLVKGPHKNNASTKSPVAVTENSNLFREVAVIVNLYGISEETKKAFLCLYPALLDIIRDASLDNEAVYPAGISPLAVLDDGIGIAQRYIVKKAVDIAAIESATKAYLQSFDASKHASHLDEYRDSFAHDPQYNATPIRFYEETDIQTTREELAGLATSERLQEIIDKMTVRIEPVVGKLKKLDWGD